LAFYLYYFIIRLPSRDATVVLPGQRSPVEDIFKGLFVHDLRDSLNLSIKLIVFTKQKVSFYQLVLSSLNRDLYKVSKERKCVQEVQKLLKLLKN